MNSFLTKKAKRKHFLDWPVMIVSFFFGGMCLIMVVDSVIELEPVLIIMGALFTTVFGFPGMNVLLRRIRVTRAKEYARCFANAKDRLLPLTSVQAQVPGHNAQKVLKKLLQKELLQGIYVDLEAGNMVIDAIAEKGPVQYLPVKCPQCGAGNQVSVGQTCRCNFCGSVLPAMGDD